MCRCLEELKALYSDICQKTFTLSEIDTQVLFVEPVLELAGWNIRDVSQIQRANRSARNQHFDIEGRIDSSSQYVRLALECKALRSPEYNIKKIDTRKGIGGLHQSTTSGLLGWKCKQKDGVGQLRSYCVKFSQYNSFVSIPVLTNGVDWVIFNNRFSNNNRLEHRLTEDDIASRASINDSDFQQKIIDCLRPSI